MMLVNHRENEYNSIIKKTKGTPSPCPSPITRARELTKGKIKP
jgi:hypothetical protein